MKLSKNKIKQLLKVKNQSQKRLHKKNGIKNRRVKTARRKKHTNLRNKTLRRRERTIVGGGAQASKGQYIEPQSDIKQDFTYYKAKLLEEKPDMDSELKTNFTNYITVLNDIILPLMDDNYIERLKLISNRELATPSEDDTQFINNYIKDKIIIRDANVIQTIDTLSNAILDDLNGILELLNQFVANIPRDEIEANKQFYDQQTNLLDKIEELINAHKPYFNLINIIIETYKHTITSIINEENQSIKFKSQELISLIQTITRYFNDIDKIRLLFEDYLLEAEFVNEQEEEEEEEEGETDDEKKERFISDIKKKISEILTFIKTKPIVPKLNVNIDIDRNYNSDILMDVYEVLRNYYVLITNPAIQFSGVVDENNVTKEDLEKQLTDIKRILLKEEEEKSVDALQQAVAESEEVFYQNKQELIPEIKRNIEEYKRKILDIHVTHQFEDVVPDTFVELLVYRQGLIDKYLQMEREKMETEKRALEEQVLPAEAGVGEVSAVIDQVPAVQAPEEEQAPREGEGENIPEEALEGEGEGANVEEQAPVVQAPAG